MTSQLQQVIHLTRALSFSEQIELLGELSDIIRKTHSEEVQSVGKDTPEFSSERFQSSWQQAVSEQTLPLSQLWQDSENV